MQGRKTSQLSAETETTQPSQLADEEPLIEEVWTPLLEQTSDPDHQPSIEHQNSYKVEQSGEEDCAETCIHLNVFD